MVYKSTVSYSETKPLEVDETSSQFVTYLRKDITEVPNVDEEGNETDGTHWEMQEAILTKEEYSQYQSMVEAIREEVTAQMTEDNLIIMEALTDIYAKLDS